jgi:hypothetical protein
MRRREGFTRAQCADGALDWVHLAPLGKLIENPSTRKELYRYKSGHPHYRAR